MPEDLSAEERRAIEQDEHDSLSHLRQFFLIPSKADLVRRTLSSATRGVNEDASVNNEPSIYLCGNSLGLQPKTASSYLQQYLNTWATKGVHGHFKPIDDSELAPWLHVDDDCASEMAKIVGASSDEVAVMQTLTANLHLMMASFYRPTRERHKVILEGKAFPSDHYAVESHIRHHNLDPTQSMVLIEPEASGTPILSTEYILSIIDTHASDTALLLLPGIQFYTGQYFDIPTITAHAQSKGIVVGWDLAHATGNVPLKLHEWNVDFAVWCSYKYLNCGPGAIGGCFVHERNSRVKEVPPKEAGGEPKFEYRPRLSGWWGSSKSSRFAMTNHFHPIPGAAGFQLSNPSVVETTMVKASLKVFGETDMEALREKSLRLTGYLEELLDGLAKEQDARSGRCFTIITPRDPAQRGAQLSVLLAPGMLDHVLERLETAGVVVDERRPDVIRVAPAPLYNTFRDVYLFVQAFRQACESVAAKKGGANSTSIMGDGGRDEKGWSEIK